MRSLREQDALRKGVNGIGALARVAKASAELARAAEELATLATAEGDPLVGPSYLDMSPREFNERCRSGEIPGGVRLGRLGWRLRRSDADRFIEGLRWQTTGAPEAANAAAPVGDDEDEQRLLADLGIERAPKRRGSR